jgi:hypothetical protein
MYQTKQFLCINNEHIMAPAPVPARRRFQSGSTCCSVLPDTLLRFYFPCKGSYRGCWKPPIHKAKARDRLVTPRTGSNVNNKCCRLEGREGETCLSEAAIVTVRTSASGCERHPLLLYLSLSLSSPSGEWSCQPNCSQAALLTICLTVPEIDRYTTKGRTPRALEKIKLLLSRMWLPHIRFSCLLSSHDKWSWQWPSPMEASF